MTRFPPPGAGAYCFGDREGWQNINETKPERDMSQYTVDDSHAMAQKSPSQCNMPLEIALNHHCGIPAVAYALAVVGPDGQVGTYVSDNVKISPKRLFSTAFRGQLLRASGTKPGSNTTGSDDYTDAMENSSVRGESPRTNNRKRARTRQSEPTVPVIRDQRLAVGDRPALKAFYTRCFRNIQQFGCKVIAKAFIKLYEPKKQTNYPYTKRKQRNPNAPSWWPLDKVIHKEPDHILRLPRVELLVHMLDVVMDQERKKTPEQKKITIKDLEIYTWAETARWFNGENGKNQNKRIFLEEIFRVAKMEERYRKGELDGTATVRTTTGDRREDTDDEDEDDVSQMNALGLNTPAQSIASPESMVSPHSAHMVSHIQMRSDGDANDFSDYSQMRQLPPSAEDTVYGDNSHFAMSNQATYAPRPQTASYHPSTLPLHDPTRRASWQPTEYSIPNPPIFSGNWGGPTNMAASPSLPYGPFAAPNAQQTNILPAPLLPSLVQQHASFEEGMYRQFDPNPSHGAILRTGSLGHPNQLPHLLHHGFQEYLHDNSEQPQLHP